ncbi:MAG: ATP-binding cassette domain-containing protein [Actinobacteria bacterium]|nr:ATP-binding cassette domain-containing protein [Actinomycetota bacterium]
MKNVTYRHGGGPVVLRAVSMRVEPRDRVALLGANGAGKTTLLCLLGGELDPVEGTVDRDEGLHIAYFSQFSDVPDDASALELLEQAAAHHLSLDEELAEIETSLGREGAPIEQLLARQQELLAEMEHTGGWDVRRRIETVLTRLGFDDELAMRPARQLSSGWRNRAALAPVLMDPPDVVLFDEPTNYLDIEGIAWLESWIRALPGAAVMASHDRHFVDQVADRIVEVAAASLDDYPVSFTEYVRQRPLRERALEKRSRIEAELWAFEADAIRDREEMRRHPSKRLHRKLANIKKDTTPPEVDQVLTGLYARLQVGERLGRGEALGMVRGGRTLFQDLDLEVVKGDRIGIVGPNGCGKSTLLALLLGDEEPAAGRVVVPPGVEWLSFEATRAALDPSSTLTWAVNRTDMVRTAPRKQVNRFLEMLRFTDLDLRKRIGDLSGGQQARAALAICLLSGAQVLVMDEPTNHLDLMSTQVMERALVHFPGAVIVVSHDRFFLDKVVTRLLVFEHGEIRAVEGGWTAYAT